MRVWEERLKQGRLELARFVAESRAVCEKQLAFLGQLPDMQVTLVAAAAAAAAAEADATADEIEEKVLSAFAAEAAEVEEEEAPAAAAVAEETGNPFGADEEDVEVTRRINLSDLKFGRNYGKD